MAPVRRASPTRSLSIEQPPSHQVQIRQRRSHFQAMQVLSQAPITHLLEAERPLDHSDCSTLARTRDLVRGFDAPATPSLALVGEVPGSRAGESGEVREFV